MRNINPTKAEQSVHIAQAVLRELYFFRFTGEGIAEIDLLCNLGRMGYDYYAFALFVSQMLEYVHYLLLSFAVKIARRLVRQYYFRVI